MLAPWSQTPSFRASHGNGGSRMSPCLKFPLVLNLPWGTSNESSLLPTTPGVYARGAVYSLQRLSIVCLRRTRSQTHRESNLLIDGREKLPTFTGDCSCHGQRVFKGSAQRQLARSIHPCSFCLPGQGCYPRATAQRLSIVRMRRARSHAHPASNLLIYVMCLRFLKRLMLNSVADFYRRLLVSWAESL